VTAVLASSHLSSFHIHRSMRIHILGNLPTTAHMRILTNRMHRAFFNPWSSPCPSKLYPSRRVTPYSARGGHSRRGIAPCSTF
jgi:hypothetical protein